MVPTAMPFARALCIVVDYYLSEGREVRFAHMLSQAGAPGVAFDEAIGEALGWFHSLPRSETLLRDRAGTSQWRHTESLTSGYTFHQSIGVICALTPVACSLMHPKLFVKV